MAALQIGCMFVVYILCFPCIYWTESSVTGNRLCSKCTCHINLRLLYCKDESLINDWDKTAFRHFNVMVLENIQSLSAVERLRPFFSSIISRETNKKTKLREVCKKRKYSYNDCIQQKPIPTEICQKGRN